MRAHTLMSLHEMNEYSGSRNNHYEVFNQQPQRQFFHHIARTMAMFYVQESYCIILESKCRHILASGLYGKMWIADAIVDALNPRIISYTTLSNQFLTFTSLKWSLLQRRNKSKEMYLAHTKL